jgi:hypothetical protein
MFTIRVAQQLKRIARRDWSRIGDHHVAAVHLDVRPIGQSHPSADDIALHGEARITGELPIQAAAALTDAAILLSAAAIRQLGRIEVAADTVEAIARFRVDLSAVTRNQMRPLARACYTAHEGALRVGGPLGDDVDDAVHGVRSPQCARGAANDLYSVEVRQRHVLRFPEHASEQLRVHAASVNHHQHLVVRDG